MLGAIVVAALAGLLGPGPLSWSSVASPDGRIVIGYSRFARDGGPIALDVLVAPEAAEAGQIDLWLSDELLDTLDVDQIVPEPASQTSQDGGIVLSFEVAEGASLEATISATADTTGRRTTGIGLAGDEPLQLSQLFYP